MQKFKVEFKVGNDKYEEKEELKFDSYEEAEKYAEEQTAIILQKGMEENLDVKDIEYNIFPVEDDVVSANQGGLKNLLKNIKGEVKYQIDWFEDGEYLYSEDELFDTKEEAIDYAEDHYAEQLEYNGRPINQEELVYEIFERTPEEGVLDAISGKGYNRAKEKENANDYTEEDFIEITNEELEANENNIEEENQEIEEEDNGFAQLEKTRKAILESIDKINENSTLKDLALINNDMEFYSDYYKDVNGVRPRYEIGTFIAEMRKKNPELYSQFEELDYGDYLKLINEK